MIKAKKSLGQNFLIDKNILDKIVNITKIKDQVVLEVGPGTGNLTSYILQKKPKKFFSNRVLPMNIPKPKPALVLSLDCKDFIYGSPILVNISLGNPDPSSSIDIVEISLSLVIEI